MPGQKREARLRADDPGIHVFCCGKKDVDGRDKPGHDGDAGSPRLFPDRGVAAFVLIVMATAFSAWVVSLGPLPLEEARKVSTTIVDRNGKLLRAYAMADGRWRLPVDAKTAVDPGYLKLLLAYEDRRFWSHGGVDPLALGRAALQLVTAATSSPAARPLRCNWRG